MRVRAREAADLQAVERFLSGRDSLRVARLGRLERTLDHPALVAEGEGGELAGVLTYVPGEAEAEILTLHAARQRGGAGTALIAALEGLATAQGWRRLWVLTTNDNVDALRFYQRRGSATDAAVPPPQLKPEIPPGGVYGIPLRDELVLEKAL